MTIMIINTNSLRYRVNKRDEIIIDLTKLFQEKYVLMCLDFRDFYS